MRKFFEEGKLSTEVIQAIMGEEKPNQKEKSSSEGSVSDSLSPNLCR